MSSFLESIIYFSIKTFSFIICLLPIRLALFLGWVIGSLAYYLDIKHKAQVYANLKIAFGGTKSFNEIKLITKKHFKNFGQNLIELMRMPLMTREKYRQLVKVDGEEHIKDSLTKGKGVILLAMHFGSWEMASISCPMMGYPYKVIVKAQTKYTKLDELLNYYRACGGAVALTRGIGTRDFVKGLKNNEVIGMVVDQGGKDGVLVPFFYRQASMSVGAIKMGLRLGVPICFSAIYREQGPYHRMIIHKPLELIDTGDIESDVIANLRKITRMMEDYINKYPAEYMWFYKIWKYSKQSNIAIFADEKIGHLRQSQTVANMLKKVLEKREITSNVVIYRVTFRSEFYEKLFKLLAMIYHPFLLQGRLEILKMFFTEESFAQIKSLKGDFIISCGSAMAGLNYILANDLNAKSIIIQRPSLLSLNKFDLVLLPEHDLKKRERRIPKNITATFGAPNLINDEYLEENTNLLLKRYSHLKGKVRTKIGVFIGGNSTKVYLSEQCIRILLRQILEVAEEINADILLTTSRRTPYYIENLLVKELKRHLHCQLLILASQDNVPEAVGGILGLSDIVVVSGDSISMISEAASSGKNAIVFLPQLKENYMFESSKHHQFIEKLDKQGFILSTEVKNVGHLIYDIAKNKIQTKRMNDDEIIFNALKEVV